MSFKDAFVCVTLTKHFSIFFSWVSIIIVWKLKESNITSERLFICKMEEYTYMLRFKRIRTDVNGHRSSIQIECENTFVYMCRPNLSRIARRALKFWHSILSMNISRQNYFPATSIVAQVVSGLNSFPYVKMNEKTNSL